MITLCSKATPLPPDADQRAFMFDYIAVDPYFFRSGYLMEHILRRIKRIDLTPAEKTTVQQLLLKRIQTKALRNFRHICRLMPQISDADFHARVAALSRSTDPAVRHRAGFALAYFAR